MKTWFPIIFIFILISCNDTIETVKIEQISNAFDNTMNVGCPGSYEILENGEYINCRFGKDKIRHGHWITYVLIVPEGSKTNKMVRAKMEEGYYHWNKRVGFWKIYNQDGTIRDSLEYKNGIAVNYEL
jgi:hypothetical protein